MSLIRHEMPQDRGVVWGLCDQWGYPYNLLDVTDIRYGLFDILTSEHNP